MPISRRRLLAGSAASGALLINEPGLAAPPLAPQGRYTDGHTARRQNAWLEIDARQFEANLRALRRQVGDQQTVCLVVKALTTRHTVCWSPTCRRSARRFASNCLASISSQAFWRLAVCPSVYRPCGASGGAARPGSLISSAPEAALPASNRRRLIGIRGTPLQDWC